MPTTTQLNEAITLHQLVLTTCPDEVIARQIATQLVTEKLAACVNIVPNLTTVYYWDDKLQTGTEVQLLIKTTEHKFAALNARMNQLHVDFISKKENNRQLIGGFVDLYIVA